MAHTRRPGDDDVALCRYLVVAEVCAAIVGGLGKSAAVKAVAERFHLDLVGRVRRHGVRTLWRWLADWEKGGLKELTRSPGKARASTLPVRFLELLLKLKGDSPDIAVPEVIRIARATGVIAEDERVDRTTVWRYCRRRDLPTRRRNASKRDRQRPWRFASRMQCVLADGKHFRAGSVRARRVAIFFLDDATRFILAAVVGTSESAALALRGLRKVISRWGLMTCFYVDLGFDTLDLARACAALRVALILGTKRYPEARGGLERFNRTAEEQLLCGWPGNPAIDPELVALERRVEHWAMEQYNHTPHEALAHETPASRFHADRRPLAIPEGQTAIDEAFVTSFTRRVTNHNCVSIDGVLWEMPLGHRREEVTIFRNMITGTLSVLHQGVRTTIKPADLTHNAHERRQALPQGEPEEPAPRKTAADLAWDRDHQPLTDDDGNYRGDQ